MDNIEILIDRLKVYCQFYKRTSHYKTYSSLHTIYIRLIVFNDYFKNHSNKFSLQNIIKISEINLITDSLLNKTFKVNLPHFTKEIVEQDKELLKNFIAEFN